MFNIFQPVSMDGINMIEPVTLACWEMVRLLILKLWFCVLPAHEHQQQVVFNRSCAISTSVYSATDLIWRLSPQLRTFFRADLEPPKQELWKNQFQSYEKTNSRFWLCGVQKVLVKWHLATLGYDPTPHMRSEPVRIHADTETMHFLCDWLSTGFAFLFHFTSCRFDCKTW
jgi:hypothetical protein